ncbi:hypothetical protein DRO54_03965 [Candidatus Bathyarchaeota archaeon]|nr:MAG: hypothetical protein DRO54_03965 [Candidatus Bathyarchaeota archaeon]
MIAPTLSEWLQIIEVIVLLATLIPMAIQVFLSRKAIEEAEKARKTSFMPRIKATLHFPAPTYAQLKMQNVGKGPAFDIEARIETAPKKDQRVWKQLVMTPDEHTIFFLPEGNFEKLAQEFDFVLINGRYKDIFGEEYEINEKIDLKEQLKELPKLRMVWQEEPLRKIGRELEEIKKGLGKIEERIRTATAKKE